MKTLNTFHAPTRYLLARYLPARFLGPALSILIVALLAAAHAPTDAATASSSGAAYQSGVRRADAPGAKRATRRKVKRKVAEKSLTKMRAGTWGGRHIGMSVTEGGAEIEYDCAHGTIDRRIELDADGRFDVTGTFVPEGGPVSVPAGGGGGEKKFSARYRGRVEGGKMTLSVTLTENGNTIDEFSLTHGRAPSLEKCY